MGDLIKLGVVAIDQPVLWYILLVVLVLSSFIRPLIRRSDLAFIWHKFVVNPTRTVITKPARSEFSARLRKWSQFFRDTDPLGRYFPPGYDVIEILIDSLTREFLPVLIDIEGGAKARVAKTDLANMFEIFRDMVLRHPVSSEVIDDLSGEPNVIAALRWMRFKRLVDLEYQEFRPGFLSQFLGRCRSYNFLIAIEFWSLVSDNHSRGDDFFIVNGTIHRWEYLSLRDLWNLFKDGLPGDPQGQVCD